MHQLTKSFHAGKVKLSALLLVTGLLVALGHQLARAQQAVEGEPVQPGIWSLKFSPDGKWLAAATNVRGKGGPIVVWRVADWQRQVVHFKKSGGLDLAFSPDSKLLAYSTRSPTVGILSTSSGMLIREFKAHENTVYSVAFTPDGQSLITSSSDRLIKVWSVESGELQSTLKGHTGTVDGIAISPDGNVLLSGGDDHTARLWNLKTGKVTRQYQPSNLIVRRVAFSHDGRFHMVSRWDGRVRVRDTATGELRAILRGGSNCSDLTANNRLLATSGWGSTPLVFSMDLTTASKDVEQKIRELIRSFKNDDYQVREKATQSLLEIGMTAEPLLREAMKSDDAEVRIRCRRIRTQIRSPQPAHRLQGHVGRVEVVSFSHDDRLLATGCRGGDVIVWEVPGFKKLKMLRAPFRPDEAE